MKAGDCKAGDKIVWYDLNFIITGIVKIITEKNVIVNLGETRRVYLYHPQEVAIWNREKHDEATEVLREMKENQSKSIRQVKDILGIEQLK